MDDLIEALQILRKYGNPAYPTTCSHDELWVVGIDPGKVSPEDIVRLEELGFDVAGSDALSECAFRSYRFGSC